MGRGVLAFVVALVILLTPQHHHQHHHPAYWRWHHRPYPRWWIRQASCIRHHEGAWTSNTGNGYYGAYQFLFSTWRSVGGRIRPDLASPAEQTYRAHRVWARDGGSWREWGSAGVCGLR